MFGTYTPRLFLALLAMALLGVACAGDDDEEPTSGATSSSEAAAAAASTETTATSTAPAASDAAMEQFETFPGDGMPQYGGQLHVAGGNPNTLNYLDNAPATALGIATETHDTLVAWDWKQDRTRYTTPAPGLATSWDVSADGAVWTFHLREDVVWHDGTPFTSADVKATYDHFLNPGDAGPPGRSYVEPFVESVDVPDPHTVVLNLKAPSPTLLINLATGWAVISAKHDVDKGMDWFKSNINGTGPFRWVPDEFVFDISYQFDRNDDYWAPGLPYLDSIKRFVLADTAANIAAFDTKRIDYTASATPDQVTDLLQRHENDLERIAQPGIGLRYILWNTRIPPFDDARVRRAMYLWMDRQEFLDKSGNGRGYLGDWVHKETFVDYGTPIEELQRSNLAHNPDKTEARKQALELLADAGYTDLGSVKIDVMSRYTSGSSLRGNQVLHSQLRGIGFDAELRTLERLAGVNALRSGEYQAAFYGGAGAYLAPESVLNRYVAPSGQRNYTGIKDPIYDKILADINRTLDPQKRADLMSQMDTYLQQGTYSMHIMFYGQTVVMRWNYLNGQKYTEPFASRYNDRTWLTDDAPGK